MPPHPSTSTTSMKINFASTSFSNSFSSPEMVGWRCRLCSFAALAYGAKTKSKVGFYTKPIYGQSNYDDKIAKLSCPVLYEIYTHIYIYI